MANRINFQVGYTVDKTGLTEIQNSLKQIQQEANNATISGNLTAGLKQASIEAEKLQTILNESWNSKLNQLDLTKFNSSIKDAYGSVSQLKTALEAGGTSGAAAYNKIASSVLSTNLQIRESNKLLNSMADTMSRTVKWGIASRAMNSLVGSIQSAWSYVQKLDTSLNDIRIVTEKSAEDMASFAESANEAAKSLGASTTDYTNASLIYYQQGLSDEEVQERADVTLKAANVTGQAASEVSEQLTAVWNGFGVTTENAEQAVDVLAAVAASTASDLEELSTGMSKVASAANAMGVGEEQLAAQLSTIISVTRQAPESVGTALKTIYARMSDIEAGVDEEGATLGSYTAEMAQMGINVLDATGSLRDMGDVIEEIGTKWSDFSREQQVALAQTMAGTRQYNNLIALFDNWDDYLDALDVANDATGTLQEQQDIYMESTAAHLQELQTTFEETYSTLLDTDSINTLIDGVTKVVDVFNNFLSSLGGGMSTLAMLGVMGANVFNNQIGKAIEKQIVNTQILKKNEEALSTVQNIANMGTSNTGSARINEAYDSQFQRQQQLLDLSKQIGSEEYNRLTDLNSEIAKLSIINAKYLDMGDEIANAKDADAALVDFQKQMEEELEAANNELANQNSIYQKMVVSAEKLSVINQDEETVNREQVLQSLEEEVELTTFLNTLDDNRYLTAEQKEAVEQARINLTNTEIPLEESLNTILEGQTNAVKNANLQRELAKQIVKEIAEYEGADLNNLAARIQTLQTLFQQGGMDENGNFLSGTDNYRQQQAISSTVQSLTSLTVGINSVTNAVKVLRNNDLSSWEKFSQIASNLMFTAPMLGRSFSSITKMLPNLATALKATAEESATWGSSLSFIGGKLSGVTPQIVAVTAAVTATVLIIRACVKAYNAQANAAEEAAESADQVAEANEAVAESYSNLQSTIDTYQSAKDELDECTKGTEEWKDALEETNSAAIELLNTVSGLQGINLSSLVAEYGELYDKTTGTFNENIIDAIEEQYNQLVNASDLASAQAEYNSSNLSARSELLNSVRSNTRNSGFDDSGNAYGMTSTEIQSKIIDNIDELVGLSEEEFKTAISDLDLDWYITDFKDLQDAVDDYATAIDNATISLEAIADVETADILGDDYSDEVSEVVSNQMTAAMEKGTKIYLNDWSGQFSKLTGGNSKGYQDIIDQLNAAGYDYSAASGQKAVQGTDKNRTFTFLDSSGQEVEFTDDAVAAMLAAADALGEVEDNANAVVDAFKHLEDSTSEGVAEGIEGYISTGTFESMSQEELNTLVQSIMDSANVSEVTADAITTYLIDALGLTGDDVEEQLEAMFGSKDYATEMLDSINEYDEALDTYLDELLTSTQQAFEDLGISNDVSVTSGKYIADVLQGAIVYGTEDTLTTLENTFSQIDTQQLDDFADALQDVDDWSSITTDDLIDILDDADVSIGLTEDELQAFIDAMEETTETVADTVAMLQETYASLHDIIDGLETGDTISSDDYTTLVSEVGDATDQYFTQMLDGTYKLTGDAEDFYNLVQSQQIKNFTDEIADLQEQLNLQNYVNGNISYNDISSNATKDTLSNSLWSNSYDSELANQQLTALKAIGYDKDQLAVWQDILSNSSDISKTRAALAEMTEAVNENEDALTDLDSVIEETENTISTLDLAIAESADSYKQLKEYLDDGTISAEAFNKVYDEIWNAEREEDLDSDEIEEYADHLQEIATESEDLADTLTEDEEAAEDLAIQIMNMNDAVDTLADNWEDWSDILSKSSKDSQEYAETINDVVDTMSKLLDIDNEFISEDFVVNHMNDIALAAEGDADAIDRLRAAAYEDILVQLDLDDSKLYDGMQYTLSDIQDWLDQNLLKVGSTIEVDTEGENEFIDSLNALIDAAGYTSDQVQAMMAAMGYDVEFEPGSETVTSEIPVTTTTHMVIDRGYTEMEDGSKVPYWTTQEISNTEYQEADSTIASVATTVNTEGGETGGGSVNSSSSASTSAHVSKITKKASGSSNNYSSSNSGGSSPGSSSSSSDEEDEPDVMDYLEDEIDLYHDINLELEAISTNLSRLQKQESKLTGQKLLDNLNQQLATLNNQISATTEKISIAQGEAASLRSQLSGQGVTFDSEGYITNYASIVESKLAYVNSCISRYNAMSAEEQEAYKDTLEDIKDDYQDFIDAISDYDTLISETIPSLEDDIQDALDEQIEIQITKFTMEVEIRLDMEEAEKDWNEFYRKVILGIDDDDILGSAQQDYADILSYYDTAGTGTGTIQTLTKQLNDTLDQLNQIDQTGTSSVYGDNQAQALEDLQTYYTELMNQLEDIEDLVDDIEESYLDMIDEAINAFEDHLDQYEYMNDLLKHDMNIIELMYGDDAYNQLSTYYQKIEDNNNSQLAFLRQRVDYAYEMMQAETDPEAQKKWQEEWENALSELNDTVEDSLENIIDKYVNTINEIIDELNDKVTSGLGLDYISEEWDLINDKADIYLDSISAMYEVQSLQSKWLDAIDSTDSIAQQQKLNELMEEQISYLEEKGELTDYDIERAELEYEIALKQIQLQEAQQNSSTMRLRRDASGNYSYEYTTDENAIADAQSELLELQNQLYNLDVEQYSNNLNNIYNAYSEFQQKLLELYEDQTLSEEERAEQEALLMEYYGDIINALVEENAIIRTNLEDSAFTLLANMYANDSENFAAMTSLNMDSYENMVSTFKDLNAESLASFNDMTDQQLEWISELTDEQLSFLSGLTDEELNIFQNMTAEQLEAYGGLTEDQIALLTGMTEEQYSLIESMTDDQINFLIDLTDAGREQFVNMTDEQRQNFYDFATGAATDYQSMVAAMLSYLDSLSEDTQETMLSEIVPGWESGVQEMADTFGDNGMTGVCKDALDALANATEEYEEDLNELASAAGVDLDEIANGYDSVESQIRSIIDAENDVIEVYANEINEIQSLMSALDSLINKYASAKSAAESAATAAYNYWQNANANAASAASTSSSSNSSSGTSTSTSGSSNSGSNSGSSGSTQGNGSINVGDRVKFNSGWYYYDSYGQTPSGNSHHGEYVYITNYKTDGRAKPIHISTGSTLGNGDLGWLTKSQISEYDTGGYTGSWEDESGSDGKGGRLAFLHQKELVLNESDTKNLLTAVSVVSDVTSLLDSLNTSTLFNISSLLDNLETFNFNNSNSEDGIIQQNVHIEATFGDSTANEIETALNNLINSASQYANKKGI